MFKGIPDYEAKFMEHVSDWVKDRVAPDKPKITSDEWKDMRCNSYERKLLLQKLDDVAFIKDVEMCVQNVQTDYVGPWAVPATCNVYVMTDGIKQTLDRLKDCLADLADARQSLSMFIDPPGPPIDRSLNSTHLTPWLSVDKRWTAFVDGFHEALRRHDAWVNKRISCAAWKEGG